MGLELWYSLLSTSSEQRTVHSTYYLMGLDTTKHARVLLYWVQGVIKIVSIVQTLFKVCTWLLLPSLFSEIVPN